VKFVLNIEVIGAGSVGMLLGSFLAQKGANVTFVVRNSQQHEALSVNPLERQSIDGQIEHFCVNVSQDLSKDADVVIVCTKFEHLHTVYPLLKELPLNTEILFVQNGLAHFKQVDLLPQKNVAFASAQFGAQKLNHIKIVHRGIGILKLAIYRGECSFISSFTEFTEEWMPIELCEDPYEMLFEKALLNCFVNPLTYIMKVQNGKLIQNEDAFNLLHQLYDELMLAFPEYKVKFPFEFVRQLCEKTSENTSSMLADRLAKRKTEIDTIVGEVIEKAMQNGHSLPTLQTLYKIVKVIEVEGT